MVKFMVMFRMAAQGAAFEETYNNFLARVEQMPHIQRRQVVDVWGSPLGEADYYRILEVYYESRDAMSESLRSSAGQEAGAQLQSLPGGSFEMLFADVYEEEGGQTLSEDAHDESVD
ncbi:MAG: hypothetical protein D6737_04640 [Chloroflexi bacterium]|nr:MAG: hypothetical protein CUN54_07830 [Phototrophicales bacterium]RMF81551.1 MAG: hypothetical protein D6737_04640 [Chloroflexota bacterium]